MYDISQPKYKGPQWFEYSGVQWKIDRFNTRAIVERLAALSRIQSVNKTEGLEPTQEEENEALCVALAKLILVDWKGEISAEYSEANALVALTNDPDLRDFVVVKSNVQDTFVNAEARKVGKKPVRPSRGSGGAKKKSKKKTKRSKKP